MASQGGSTSRVGNRVGLGRAGLKNSKPGRATAAHGPGHFFNPQARPSPWPVDMSGRGPGGLGLVGRSILKKIIYYKIFDVYIKK